MNYYRILTSENTNDKTDLYLMIKDDRPANKSHGKISRKI